MKIISNEPLILDEIFHILKLEHIEVSKETKEIDGAMGVGATIALILDSVEKITKILTFLANQKNYYIHIKLKDGREMKLNNISKEKQQQEFEAVKNNKEILSIDIGRK